MNNHMIHVDRLELLWTLKSNCEKHVHEYNKAVVQFRIDVIEEMKENLAKAEKGGTLHLMLTKHNNPPRSYEQEYRRAIKRYEMTVDETVYLDENQFQQYVMNEWQWSHQITNSIYASKAN